MAGEQPHIRRAWTTDGGTRIRLESRSYTAPLFTVHGSEQPRRRSLFHTAFSLLGAVHNMQREYRHQQEPDATNRTAPRGPPRSFSFQHDVSGTHDRRSSRVDEQPDRSYEQRPRDRSPSTRSHRKYRREESSSQDYDDQEHMNRSRRSDAERTRIKELEFQVLCEQREVRECSRWLDDYYSRPEGNRSMLRHMVSRSERHKRRLREAEIELELAVKRLEGRSNAKHERRRRSSPAQSRQGRVPPEHLPPPGLEHLFSFFLGGAVPRTSADQVPPFTTHGGLFNHLFAQMTNDESFNSHGFGPGSDTFAHDFFRAYSDQDGFGSRGPQGTAGFAQPRARPGRPSQVLSTQETKAWYQAYNERWTSLGPSDSEVPYPGRNLQSAALLDQQTVWTPLVSSPVSSWSAEDVIRVNAQTFFLAVADLVPTYTDALSKINLDFDHSRATPGQLQLLADLLKKEKLRWHSDKLGRRNGGQGGVNVALQQHEVARGVFHAVCELSDLVAAKR